MLDLREHRKAPDRLSDLLPWAALVSPEVVLNKDGSFQGTIKYRGPDLDSSTEEELMANAASINNILRRFGSGWVIYAEGVRFSGNPYPESNFPDPVARLIDERRKERFSREPHFDSNYYLTLCYLPPKENTNRLASLFLSSSSEEKINYEALLENFRAELYRVVDLLERLFPEAEILIEDDLLTYLHSTVSESRSRVSLSEVPMFLDSILSDTPLLGGFSPCLGEMHLGVLCVLGFPGSSQPGLLDQLNRLPLTYRWVTRFIALDKLSAKREIEIYQRKWFSKRKGMTALIRELVTREESALSDSEAISKAEDAKEALFELGSDDISYGFLTTTVVLLSSSSRALRADLSQVQKVLHAQGFTTKLETVNAVDAWLGSIPSNPRNNVRRPLVSTMNLSHLLPGTSAVWAGESRNEHLGGPPLLFGETEGGTAFRLSTHYGDVGHTLVLGPTGSGKSTLLNLIEAQFLRYPDAQVYIFDKGQSAYALTTAVGGEHYNLGAEDSELYFQPLGLVHDDQERKWAHDWLLALCKKENVSITPQVKRVLWDALCSLSSTPREQRTLHALMVYLQNMELRAAFEPFTQGGAYGRLIDNTTDSLEYARWQCFEMEELMDTPTVVGPVLAYLFHRLAQRFDGSPTLLVLDEAWLFLDHPTFSSKIREWLKTLRKVNVSVIFATQSLVDVTSSSISPTIKEACYTKIYLPNPVALQPDASEFYKSFGLNSRQIEILAFSMPKRDYYYTSPLGNRLFDLALDELQLAYLAGVSKKRVSLVRSLKAHSSSTAHFNARYLRELGLKDYVEYFEEEIERERKTETKIRSAA